MKILSKLFASAVLLSVCLAAVAAQSVVGTWKGKVAMDFSKLPKPTNPQQAQRIAETKQKMAHLVLTLIFKKDHTFMAMDSQSKKSQNGGWSMSGSSVSLTSPQAKSVPQMFDLSRDGRMLTMKRGPVTITFRKS